MPDAPREKLNSRIGFIFLSAACAIGLGNIWRFPFVTGKYGGAAFVLMYLICLAALGLPVLVMELALGRASGRNLVGAYEKLAPPDCRFPWAKFGRVFFSGNIILMMFYTTVCGWLMAYFWYYLDGSIAGCADVAAVGAFFGGLAASPDRTVLFMGLCVLFSMIVCAAGLRRGVERVVKSMMAVLFVMLFVLAVKALSMPGAKEALRFYLLPDFSSWRGLRFFDVLFAAAGQAFFTLSLGVGSMAIFGSYIGKEHSLTTESIWIVLLDTVVAVVSGLIIFPICFSFGIAPGEGPTLVFVSMPNIFNSMAGGRWWGLLFFGFMSFAAITTVIAVFENLIAYLIDEHRISRRKASLIVGAGIFVLSLPCVLGFSLWKRIQPLGGGSTILDLEDFIVSQNILPLGALCILFFCVLKRGWGWEKFLAEADAGAGISFPRYAFFYLRWVLPLVFLAVFAVGYYAKFA